MRVYCRKNSDVSLPPAAAVADRLLVVLGVGEPEGVTVRVGDTLMIELGDDVPLNAALPLSASEVLSAVLLLEGKLASEHKEHVAGAARCAKGCHPSGRKGAARAR